jgi:fructose-specific phosphotransferase system IIC component
MRRLGNVAAIVLLAVLLFPLTASYLTGDVSRWLPARLFAAGTQGKDQIIIASAVATFVVALLLAIVIWRVLTILWRRLRAS